jgi:acetyltransferase
LIQAWRAAGGWQIELRPILPEDESIWLEFLGSMSWATRYKRGARRVEQLSAEEVQRALRPRHDSELAFIAVASRDGRRDVAGVSRGTFVAENACEFTLVVADRWQRHGIGVRLMQTLIDAAVERGQRRIVGRVLASNLGMLEFVGRLGFAVEDQPGEPYVKRVVLERAAAPPQAG